MRIKIIVLIFFCSIFIINSGYARYAMLDLEKIPIQRLIENLTVKHENNPNDNQILFALARTYAMAFSSRKADVDVRKGQEGAGPWFGYEPRNVPYANQKSTNNDESETAHQEYLDKAIELHKKALNNDPDNLLIQIGLTWCLEQNGQIDEAIFGYRRIITMAWPEEKKKKSSSGSPLITEEASQYLIPLLDPVKDAVEIAKLKKYQKHFDNLPRAITPIVIPLTNNLDFEHIKANEQHVSFDLDGSGIPKKWEWINPNAGFLIFDKDQSGEINSALQLFGNVTFWLFWDNGYVALQSLDDNNDGKLTEKELNGLAVWQDINQNGESEEGEVKSLIEWGIKEVSCEYTFREDGTPYNSSGVLFANGKTHPSYDLYLKNQDLSIALTMEDSNYER